MWISAQDACSRRGELTAGAAAGEVVVVVREDGAAVRHVPEPSTRPRFGIAQGMFTMRHDFDAPLEDFRPCEAAEPGEA